MITITRSLARQLRAVFRRAGQHNRVFENWIAFTAGADGLRIRATSNELAIEYHLPGQFDPQELIAPIELLAACEGRGDDVVTLTPQNKDKLLASWTDRGIPQQLEYGVDRKAAAKTFPPLPESFASNPPELLEAIQAAAATVDRESSHYALGYLQLRGRDGRIVATDGRQALVQAGFQFPCEEEFLIPASPVFGCRELPQNEPVNLGIAGDWLAFIVGPWTIWLRINRAGRFPNVDDLVPKPTVTVSRLTINPLDADFLASTLDRLPNDEVMNRPVTLDLNGQVIIRSKPLGQTRSTELVLSRSTLTGEALAINLNREYLVRAIRLGFHDVCFFGNASPALCDDGQRRYIWALLSPEDAIRSCEDSIRIDSAAHVARQKPRHPKHSRRRSKVIQSTTSPAEAQQAETVPHATDKLGSNGDASSCIAKAIALRATLRETLTQSNDLLRALKREKSQSRLLASTLASLKQLQKVAG